MKITKRQRPLLSGLAVFFLALLYSCATLPLSSPNDSNPIVKVAVLPIHNFTPDMDGPVRLRSGISKMILTKCYTVIPNDQVDQILRDEMGVTLGGQLDYTNPKTRAPSPSLVGQALDVDGLIYCNLEDFENIISLVVNRKRIKVKCSLVNVRTTSVVWEKEEEVINVELNVQAGDLAFALIKAFTPNQLDREIAAVINNMRNTIPSGPVVSESSIHKQTIYKGDKAYEE